MKHYRQPKRFPTEEIWCLHQRLETHTCTLETSNAAMLLLLIKRRRIRSRSTERRTLANKALSVEECLTYCCPLGASYCNNCCNRTAGRSWPFSSHIAAKQYVGAKSIFATPCNQYGTPKFLHPNKHTHTHFPHYPHWHLFILIWLIYFWTIH